MNEKYFSDYEWELSYPIRENDLLIKGPGELEILIDNLNFSLSIKTTHFYEELEQVSVGYPIEIESNYSKDNYNIQVITTNGINNSAILQIGSKVSWNIPFDFARQLQSALLGKSVI